MFPFSNDFPKEPEPKTNSYLPSTASSIKYMVEVDVIVSKSVAFVYSTTVSSAAEFWILTEILLVSTFLFGIIYLWGFAKSTVNLCVKGIPSLIVIGSVKVFAVFFTVYASGVT